MEARKRVERLQLTPGMFAASSASMLSHAFSYFQELPVVIEEAPMKRLRKKLYPCFHQWSIAHAGNLHPACLWVYTHLAGNAPCDQCYPTSSQWASCVARTQWSGCIA